MEGIASGKEVIEPGSRKNNWTAGMSGQVKQESTP
jgi:hypothetical protein